MLRAIGSRNDMAPRVASGAYAVGSWVGSLAPACLQSSPDRAPGVLGVWVSRSFEYTRAWTTLRRQADCLFALCAIKAENAGSQRLVAARQAPISSERCLRVV